MGIVIAATLRLDTDFNEALALWNECLAVVLARGWPIDGCHADFFDSLDSRLNEP